MCKIERTLLPALAAATGLLLACADCDRAGCDALTKMATPGGSGIAGVVAQSSDVVSNGCQECPLATATLQVWTLEERLDRRSRAAEVVSARPPDLTREIDGGYREILDPGWYLLCVRPSCVELNVHEWLSEESRSAKFYLTTLPR